MKNKLAVIDFGGQYAHLIANRVRRLGVYAEVLPSYASLEELEPFKAVILSGGPASVYSPDAPEFNPELLKTKVPVLGICYGHQLLCIHYGGKVEQSPQREYGPAKFSPQGGSRLLEGVSSQTTMWMSHGDEVRHIPEDFHVIGQTSACPFAAISNSSNTRFGIQFHPEVTHSVEGSKVLENFLNICGLSKDWDMASYLENLKARLIKQCQGKNVFLLVSGGVDSTVAFGLLNNVLGPERVKGLHIDNGLMRKDESREIMDFMSAQGFENLIFCDAKKDFLNKLEGVYEPEAKRKIIGDTFLEVLDNQVSALRLDPEKWIMAQGTTYPDTIESGGTKNSATIKTHHNRVPKAVEMLEKGLIIEPLAELYKDEVRALGTELGIPDHLVWRHPFPGPGLGVRYLCLDALSAKAADNSPAGLSSYLKEKNLKGKMLPIKSVGVQGDGRTYAHPCLLSSVPNWEAVKDVSTEITNQFSEINRVVLEIAHAGDGEYIAVEQQLDENKLHFLREADALCTEALFANNLYKDIWQMPVVLLPLEIGGKPVVVMRPIHSSEAMTANYAEIDFGILNNLWEKLKAIGTGALLYDITHKPPGTIEWE